MSILTWLLGLRLDAPGVYRIRNRKNDKVYIGSTRRTIRVRLDEHISRLQAGTHPNAPLQADWDVYGPRSFAFEIIENTASERAEYQELYWQQRTPIGQTYVQRIARPAEVIQQRRAQRERDFATLIDALILLGWTDEDFTRTFKAHVVATAIERRDTIDVTDTRPLQWLREHAPKVKDEKGERVISY